MYERRRKVMETDTIIHNDCLDALKDMPSESVHCCVTSPPYYGLRDYGMDGQVGREATPEQYIRFQHLDVLKYIVGQGVLTKI